jgi:hypothetical protein
MTGQTKQTGEGRIRRIIQLFKEAESGDCTAVSSRLREVRELVHEQIAEQFTEPFNRHLAAMPKTTQSQKRDLVRFANAEMRALGVTAKCPKTKRFAMLHVDAGPNVPDGRFQLELIGSDSGGRKTLSSSTLFSIDLIGCPDRREPLAEYWNQRATKGGSHRR